MVNAPAMIRYAIPEQEPAAPVGQFSHNWDHAVARLYEIRLLRDNWDDDGGKAPDPAVVDAAIRLLRRWRNEWSQGRGMITAPSRVSVSPEGGVYMDWSVPGHFRSLEIHSPLVAEWMEAEAGRPNRHWNERINLQRERHLDSFDMSAWG